MKVKPQPKEGGVDVVIEMDDDEALELWQNSKQIYPIGRELRKALADIVVEPVETPIYEERTTVSKVQVGFKVVPAHITGREVEAEQRRLEKERVAREAAHA